MPASTLLAGLLVAALLGGCVAPRQGDWWLARRDSSGQAPDAAVTAYPSRGDYRLWPDPNSNTFTAFVGRSVPELRLKLPSTAIGKDYLPGGALVAKTPGGRGVQLSLFGVAGVGAGWDEGLEVNVLGLVFGLDVTSPGLKLPGVGHIGIP